jgi:hypothetical protein
MNELDLVKELCTAVTPADPGRLARARAQLTYAAQAASEAGAPEPAGAGESRILLGRVHWPAPGRTRLAMAGGLVVVMAAGLSTGLSLAGGGRAPLTAPASAMAVLARAARVSAAEPMPRNDQYIYTEATGLSPASLQPGSHKIIRYTTRTWSSVDGKTGDLIHQTPCQRVPGGPDGLGPLSCGERVSKVNQLNQAIRLPNGRVEALTAPLGKLPKGAKLLPTLPTTYAAARALPTNARQLDTYLKQLQIVSLAITGSSVPIWQQLTTLVEWVPVLPPKLAAAVFTLASQQPGITLQHVTDAAGRPGIGISQAGDPSHVQLIFNPVTYELEGINVSDSELIMTPLSPVAGAQSMAILHTAIVNSEPSS